MMPVMIYQAAGAEQPGKTKAKEGVGYEM